MVSAISNWRNERPKSYYPECIKMFGKPTFVANVKDGYALWKTRGLFSQHLLIDEEVKHCVPRVHYDYFYSSVKFFIPKDKVCDVLKISGSLNYDGLKKGTYGALWSDRCKLCYSLFRYVGCIW